ncbi:MAG: sigma-70 family RNA polymerase sigma factor [Clostridia bacterium]|nr:sigma-70 family RNA polymerase sigma factor [Clostridia bacterium]
MTKRERSCDPGENLGLVRAAALRFVGRGIDYEELYSAGCLGLVKASDRFDEKRGNCFSTYAVPLILGEIKSLFRNGGALKVSRSLREAAIKVTAARNDYIARCGTEPTIKELASMTDIGEDTAAQALCACRIPLSLTQGNDEEGIVEIPVDSQEEQLSEKLSLRQELERLSKDDRKLIDLRYFRSLTQTQTAKLLGTTQVRICRREKKILAYLRERLS